MVVGTASGMFLDPTKKIKINCEYKYYNHFSLIKKVKNPLIFNSKSIMVRVSYLNGFSYIVQHYRT